MLRYNYATEIESRSGALTPSGVAPKGLVSMRREFTSTFPYQLKSQPAIVSVAVGSAPALHRVTTRNAVG
jgi:hypothetical protein